MKKTEILGLAATFAGCLLGAGYVSGQELWLYFGSYGKSGVFGLILSILLVMIAGFLILMIAGDSGADTIDRILFRFNIPWMRDAVGILFTVLYFFIGIVMIAGIASLGEQLLGFNKIFCAVIATVVIMTCVYLGIEGMVKIFSLTIPILVVAATGIGLLRITQAGSNSIVFTPGKTNAILGTWLSSSLNYASMNIFCSIGIIAPLAKGIKKKSDGFFGMILGAFGLILIAVTIICALACSRDSINYDLPMLNLSQNMGTVFGLIYGILLFLAMFGNANGTLVAANDYLDSRLGIDRKKRLIRIILIGVFEFTGSLAGFSNLIGTVYPIIGYIGLISVFFLIEHTIYVLRKRKKTGKYHGKA